MVQARHGEVGCRVRIDIFVKLLALLSAARSVIAFVAIISEARLPLVLLLLLIQLLSRELLCAWVQSLEVLLNFLAFAHLEEAGAACGRSWW